MADEELLDDDVYDDIDELEVDDSEQQESTESAKNDALVSEFRKYGFDIPDGIDGRTLAENIRLMAQRQQQLPNDMELAELREIRERYRQQQPEKQEEAEAPAKSAKLSKPEGAEDYVVFDDKAGMYVPKDQRFPNIKAVEEMNRWHKAVEANRRKLLEDPEDYIRSTFDIDKRLEEVKKSAREEALAEFQRMQQAQALERERATFWEKHAPELYQVDERGFIRSDSFTGQHLLTEKGMKYLEAVGHLQQKYPGAPAHVVERDAFEMATRWERGQKARASREAKQEAEQVDAEMAEPIEAEDPKQSFTKRARAAEESGKTKKGDRVVNRDASVVSAARNGTAQNGGLDFIELAKANAKAKGVKL